MVDQTVNGVQPRPLTGKPKTQGYRPSMYASYPTWFSLGWGSFSLGIVDAMRRDPQVALCLTYRQSPVWSAEFDVVAADPEEQQYVDETIKRFWRKSLGVAIEAMAFGYSASEAMYKMQNGRIWFNSLKALHPKDVRPYTKGGHLHHIKVEHIDGGDVDLLAAMENRPCEGFWLAHDTKYSPWYGRSVLMPAWWFWRIKTMEDGIVESIFKWLYKHSISCTIVRHPNQVFDTDGGVITPAQDLSREMVDNVKAGGVIAMNSDKDEHGDYLWKIEEWAKPTGNAESLIEVADWIDKQIQRGILLPDEVVTHEGNTGGYSRSQVAAGAFIMQAEQDLNHIHETVDEQIIRPLVLLNFGKATYKITPKPLAPPLSQAMQQPGQPGQPGQPPQPGQPGMPQPDQGGQPPGMPGQQPPGGQQALPWDSQGQHGKQMSAIDYVKKTFLPLSFEPPAQVVQLAATVTPQEWGKIVTKLAPHVRIVGSTGSGKTTVAQAIASSVEGKVFIIDPVYTPSSWGGLPAATVAADGSYGPIEEAIEGLLEEMKRRGAELQSGKTEFERLTVIFDEVPDTVAELKESAGMLIRRLAQRGRHENIHLVGIGQSSRVEPWGIAGYGDVAENFVTLYLGNKAIEKMPSLAGQEWPGALEWEGKLYPVDISGVIHAANKKIDSAKSFKLPKNGEPKQLAQPVLRRKIVRRALAQAEERFGAEKAQKLVQQFAWERQPTERSQNRWLNTITGEIRYQEVAPRARPAIEGEEPTPSDLAKIKSDEDQRNRIKYGSMMDVWDKEDRKLKKSPWGIFEFPMPKVASVTFSYNTNKKDAEDYLKSVFGPNATLDDLIAASGATSGSRVTIGGRGNVSVQGDGWSTHGAFSSDKTVYGSGMTNRTGAPGVGLEVLSRQVYNGMRLGAKYIGLNGIGDADDARLGSGQWTGYKTWPKMGFDCPITNFNSTLQEQIKAKFPTAKTLLDIYESKEGRKWWADNGTSINAKFDLTPGSRSLKVLAAVQKAMARRLQDMEDEQTANAPDEPTISGGAPTPVRRRRRRSSAAANRVAWQQREAEIRAERLRANAAHAASLPDSAPMRPDPTQEPATDEETLASRYGQDRLNSARRVISNFNALSQSSQEGFLRRHVGLDNLPTPTGPPLESRQLAGHTVTIEQSAWGHMPDSVVLRVNGTPLLRFRDHAEATNFVNEIQSGSHPDVALLLQGLRSGSVPENSAGAMAHA